MIIVVKVSSERASFHIFEHRNNDFFIYFFGWRRYLSPGLTPYEMNCGIGMGYLTRTITLTFSLK
jgi:hypothetical protein